MGTRPNYFVQFSYIFYERRQYNYYIGNVA